MAGNPMGCDGAVWRGHAWERLMLLPLLSPKERSMSLASSVDSFMWNVCRSAVSSLPRAGAFKWEHRPGS